MDLKTGNLLWPALSPPVVVPEELTTSHSCEVLVLGAGVTGAFCACLLAEAGVDVIVVDRRGVAEGSTPASTALVQYEIDTPLTELAATIGIEPAQQAYRGCRGALDQMVDLLRRHAIHCDLRWCGSLFLARHAEEADDFVREASARQAIGIEVEPLSRRELADRFDIDRPAALHSLAAMELDPVKLTHGLMRTACHLGARVFLADGSIEPDSDRGMRFTSAHGPTVDSRTVAIATGYEAPEQFRHVRGYCQLKSTFALASRPLDADPWPGGVMIWESGSPYFYARLTADRRVVVGGEDEPFSDPAKRDALIDQKTGVLVEKLRELRPGLTVEPEFSWAGTFAESADGLPLIGRLPKYPHCHFALGYGGNGLTFALLAAQIICDDVRGRVHPLARVFRFDR